MFNKARPVLDYNMRTYKYEPDTHRVYLYDFGGVTTNGYFIRQEIAHDLLLRGLPNVASLAVNGSMFVNEQGAGVVLEPDWFEAQGVDQLLVELCEVSRKVAEGEEV